MIETRRLRTIKKASRATGASERFLKQLITDGILTRYKIRSATYINLEEFYNVAIPIKKSKS